MEFMTSDYNAKVFNYYQIRIRVKGRDDFWDWYHTSGSLVHTIPSKSVARVNGEDAYYKTAVEVIQIIYDKYLQNE